MKFRFKIQQYQTDAVNSVIKVFEGQPFLDKIKYTRDLGIRKTQSQMSLYDETYDKDDIGFENAKIILSDDEILKNIKSVQAENNIKQSSTLVKHLGRCSLDIEMETGTGKTYVYIKSIFELNKKYGWSKFIIVVPSLAIREGVKKSFEITEEHFMEYYGKKARFFIYNSAKLNDLDSFSSSNSINVMIINSQAFNATGKDARRIDMILDDFQSRKPIEVIAKNRPILILDEPQKLGGVKTQEGLKRFNPLFVMSFSATHTKQNNLIYVLDALEAYNHKLVKKIEVKGFEIKNLRGTGKYIYLSGIILSKNKPPMARIEFEINYQKSINREVRILGVGDNLYHLSAGNNGKMPKLEQYKNGYVISEINTIKNTVTFLNGEVLTSGEAKGGVNEKDLRRIQIRETILSHFEKEEDNYYKGIKTLSLFFIDEVAKYRLYNESGNECNGDYADVFEREYNSILNDYITLEETPYVKYLKRIEVKTTHKGYFSIDKKTNRLVDGSISRRGETAGLSDDISAYELILKNKERLLSFDEPTRFIFSHSTLREGWDNSNVFQICTLKHSDSTVTKRQEVGRGMRLCVNITGDRMDSSVSGISVHDLNKLTVIASDSYTDFVTGLQKEIRAELYDRPAKADKEYFQGKFVKDSKEKTIQIDRKMASLIHRYLIKNDYTDDEDKVTDKYHTDNTNNNLAKLPEELEEYSDSIHKLIQSVFDENIIKSMFENGNASKVVDNALNNNFYKKEFQTLWNHINHKYAYRVNFTSEELISKTIEHIDKELYVSELTYLRKTGEQKSEIDEQSIVSADSIRITGTETIRLKRSSNSDVKYDPIGMIAKGATLTRKTVTKILQGIKLPTFSMFKINPEEFITKVIKIINEQKAALTVEHIQYNVADGVYESNIFTAEKSRSEINKAFKANKHIQDYVFTDGTAEKSVERRFAESLDTAKEVCVYAKLPRGFSIPTPVGNYSPDWAIAFNEGAVKHIYFIAETKGSMSTLDLRPIEKAKIDCAKKLFNELSTSNVKYHDVIDYQGMLNIINKL